MKKKIFLLLLSGAVIFVGYIASILAIDTVRTAFMPGLVEVNEADFLKMLKSHQVVVLATSHVTGPGLDSYSVIWSYKNPNPPGNEIECATDWVKGSPDDLMALMKQYPASALSKPTLMATLLHRVPLILFLVAACVIFRQEISMLFRRKASVSL